MANKWNITRRRVQILCTQSRIEGAIKVANLWLIPKEAEKPSDRQITTKQALNDEHRFIRNEELR